MNPGEEETLVALIGSVHPEAVLEFGVNEGMTAKAILEQVSGVESYQGIDVFSGYVPSMAVQIGEIPVRPGYHAVSFPQFELILRRHGSADLRAYDLKPCDAVFIDGDHSRAAIIHDTMLARSLCKKGGIIIWHDYHTLGTVDVKEVLEEFAAEGASIYNVEDTWIAFERVA